MTSYVFRQDSCNNSVPHFSMPVLYGNISSCYPASWTSAAKEFYLNAIVDAGWDSVQVKNETSRVAARVAAAMTHHQVDLSLLLLTVQADLLELQKLRICKSEVTAEQYLEILRKKTLINAGTFRAIFEAPANAFTYGLAKETDREALLKLLAFLVKEFGLSEPEPTAAAPSKKEQKEEKKDPPAAKKVDTPKKAYTLVFLL